jgi:hypothetical protein
MKKLTPEKRAEIRRLIEEVRGDLREIRTMLERVQARMEAQGR